MCGAANCTRRGVTVASGEPALPTPTECSDDDSSATLVPVKPVVDSTRDGVPADALSTRDGVAVPVVAETDSNGAKDACNAFRALSLTAAAAAPAPPTTGPTGLMGDCAAAADSDGTRMFILEADNPAVEPVEPVDAAYRIL